MCKKPSVCNIKVAYAKTLQEPKFLECASYVALFIVTVNHDSNGATLCRLD